MKVGTFFVATSALSGGSAYAASLLWAESNFNVNLQSVLNGATKLFGSLSPANLVDVTTKDINAIATLLGDERDEFGALRRRLIDTGDAQFVIESDEDKFALMRKGIKFVDITDHHDFYQELEHETVTVNAAAPVFPGNVSHYHEVQKLIPDLSKDNLFNTLSNYSSFRTRYAKSTDGLEASLWLFHQISDIAKANKKIRVHPFSHSWSQKSVIAHFPGKHSKGKPDEPVVIISAHLDSINLLLPSILPAPGADDDGSGTVTILEAFRVLVESGYVPETNLEFHWYSAEELGLLGSQDILNEYKKNGINVKAQFQQDMTGYVKDKSKERFAVITDFVSPELTKYVEVLIDHYTDLPYVEGECGYGCSDHASGYKVGFPSAFVIEDLLSDASPYIHSTRDTVDKLDFDHMLQHAKLTLAFAYELGKHKF